MNDGKLFGGADDNLILLPSTGVIQIDFQIPSKPTYLPSSIII
jgi:hypothetical protein